jgi:hypothetical protein
VYIIKFYLAPPVFQIYNAHGAEGFLSSRASNELADWRRNGSRRPKVLGIDENLEARSQAFGHAC